MIPLESPFAGKGATREEQELDELRNRVYLRACLRDSLLLGEAPFASHGLYTQAGVLDDRDPVERELGIKAGFAWRASSSLTAVYMDRGVSRGMEMGIADARAKGRHIAYRNVPGWTE